MSMNRARSSARGARTLLAAGLSAALCSGALAGRADELQGTRSEKVLETSHRIELRLDRGHAELVVRRTIHNGGARHDQATYMLDIPTGAVATGLATLGVKD